MSEKLTMQDLITFLASRQEITKEEATIFLRELFAIIYESIEQQDSVSIKDFGTFKLIKIDGRKSVNANTDTCIEIPTHVKLSFTPDKILSEALNKPFACFESVLLEEGVSFADIEIIEEAGIENDPDISDEFFTVSEPLNSENIIHKDNLASEIKESLGSDYFDSEQAVPDESDTQIEILNTSSDSFIDAKPQDETVPIESVNETLKVREKYKSGWTVFGIIIVILLICTYIYRGNIFQNNDLHWGNIIAEQAEISLSDTILNVEFQDEGENDNEEQIEINNIDEEIDEPKSLVEVKYGDTLRNIGFRAYGNKSFWVYIYQENIQKIPDFNNVPIGTILVIPANDKYGIDATNPESVQKARDLEKEYFGH